MALVVDGKKCPTSYRKKDLVALASKRLGIPSAELEKFTMQKICELIASGSLPKTPIKKSPKVKSSKSTKVSSKIGKAPSKVGCPPGIKRADLVKMASKKLGVEEKSLAKMNMAEICAAMEGKKTPVPKKSSKVKVKITPVPKIPKSPKPTTPIGSLKIPSKPVKSCIERSNLKLLPHQLRAVNYLKTHRGLIVAHTVGSGKTLIAVVSSQCFLDENPKGRVKIVTPVSLQQNMKKEFKAAGADPNDPRYEFYTLHGFANHFAKKLSSDAAKKEWENTMLIIDEAHELRTDIQVAKRKTKGEGIVRAEVAVRAARMARKVLLLTGTAIFNEPHDLANLVAMVKGRPPLSTRAFEQMVSSDCTFKEYFSCVMSFYDAPKDENYPTVKESYVEFEMTPKYYKEYKAVENRTSQLFSAQNPYRFLVGFRQASNALTECIKCDWVLKKAQEGKKMEIFSSFITYGLEKMQEKLIKAKIPFVQIIGSMDRQERERAVEKI